MTLRCKQLPEVPTVRELLNLVMAQMVPVADACVAVLPPGADPRWATELGLRFFLLTQLEAWAAKDELHRTPWHCTQRRVRARQVRRLERQFEGRALTVLSAIADQVRAHHPETSAAQLLTASRDAFGYLLHHASVGGLGGR